MKPHTLPVKRVPENKGILRRLSAVTGNRRQRVAAAAAAPPSDLDADESGSKISRALTVIFLVHIVVIGLIFFHQKYMAGRSPDAGNKPVAGLHPAAPAAAPARQELPRLSSGEKPYIVQPGDNYGRIASELEVDEQDLRVLNKHVDISQGLILRIPPKRIVADEPPEVAAIRSRIPADDDAGLVEAVDVTHAPKARLVRPAVPVAAAQEPAGDARPMQPVTASGKTHVVQQGESIFRIAGRYKVKQDSLMRANNITDPKKMKVGMKLVIPAS